MIKHFAPIDWATALAELSGAFFCVAEALSCDAAPEGTLLVSFLIVVAREARTRSLNRLERINIRSDIQQLYVPGKFLDFVSGHKQHVARLKLNIALQINGFT